MEWIVFILFFLLLLLRVPVAIALVFSASLALLDSGFNLDVLPQKMFSALNVATLMAIPGFILAGVLMSRGGFQKR